jgi:phosphatidylserine decarboxylase
MRIPIARDGLRLILPPLAVAVVFACLGWWIPAGLFAVAAAFLTFFFRDFERTTPRIENAVFASGDGLVDDIAVVEAEEFPGGKALKIGVFLSVFNCHITRAPAPGRVTRIRYQPGSFHNAMSRRSSQSNENNSILLDQDGSPILVRQIAGAIARRIVCTARIGQRLSAGERVGLIRMGSRVEVYVPTDSQLRVKPGAKVKAGQSVLAILQPGSP